MSRKERLREAVQHLNQIDLNQVRFIPEGANDPLPAIPGEVNLTPADAERAIAKWDKLMPEYKGLLEAVVKNKREHA